MFSKSITKHFKGFGSGFTEFHAKLDADTLLGDKTKHEVKTVRVHSVVSRARLM
jgi:hypothetical protein